jgi:hypothetical protein
VIAHPEHLLELRVVCADGATFCRRQHLEALRRNCVRRVRRERPPGYRQCGDRCDARVAMLLQRICEHDLVSFLR